MNRVFAGLAAVALATTPLPALAQAPAPATTVNLPVELKDPFHAYSLGLIPFGGHAAASYVGTDRFSWETPENLRTSANTSLITDVVILVGGAMLANTEVGRGAPMPLLTIAALVGSHALWYAPYWGDRAVDFNYSQVKRHGFKAEAAGK